MAQQLPAWADNEFLDKAVKYDLNGRQIKNVVRMAHALAQDKSRDMEPEDIMSVMRLIKAFEEDVDAQSMERSN
jgi:predicted ATP-dependent protease